MRRTCLIVLLATAWIEMSAATVSAQMWPGRSRNHSSYDVDAYDTAVGLYALNSSNNAARATAQAYQAWGRESSQQMAMESGIRSAMDAGAQQRAQDIYNQQQGNRDWWFQTQQQQVARRQAEAVQQPAPAATWQGQAAAPPEPVVPRQDSALQPRVRESQWQQQDAQWEELATPDVPGFELAPSVAPPVATDVIKWWPLLQAPQFAEQRARIEAPYRRSAKGLSVPTAQDYRDMIDATEKMKVILKGMVANITAHDYLNAEAFIDRLATQARERLEKLEKAAPAK